MIRKGKIYDTDIGLNKSKSTDAHLCVSEFNHKIIISGSHRMTVEMGTVDKYICIFCRAWSLSNKS